MTTGNLRRAAQKLFVGLIPRYDAGALRLGAARDDQLLLPGGAVVGGLVTRLVQEVALWGAVLLLVGAFAEIVRRAWRTRPTAAGGGVTARPAGAPCVCPCVRPCVRPGRARARPFRGTCRAILTDPTHRQPRSRPLPCGARCPPDARPMCVAARSVVRGRQFRRYRAFQFLSAMAVVI